MKIPIELIRDSEEPNEPEPSEDDERTAEEYHRCMMTGDHTGRQRSIYEEVEAALRSAPVQSWKQLFQKWG